MPVRQRIGPITGAAHDPLKQRLIEEWLHPQEVPGNPIIIEERSAFGPASTRLYVVWDQWADLDQLERSAIILNALEEAKGTEAIRDVSLAMGLTPDEACRLGIQY